MKHNILFRVSKSKMPKIEQFLDENNIESEIIELYKIAEIEDMQSSVITKFLQSEGILVIKSYEE